MVFLPLLLEGAEAAEFLGEMAAEARAAYQEWKTAKQLKALADSMNAANESADEKLKNASQAQPCASCAAAAAGSPDPDGDKKKKPNSQAADKYKNKPSQFEGKSPQEVEQQLDDDLVDQNGWTKDTLNDGNGVRYYDGKGNSIQINNGYPDGGGDLVHQGPYVKISPGLIRVPLQGNPAL
jgi:hypothetical protein